MRDPRPSPVPDEAGAPEPIAIIGMACLFPQAPDLQAFWNNILGGVDAVGEPVPSWDAERYLAAGRIRTARGGYLKDLYRFDPREFGIMPNSLDGGEPDQFLALRVARDALRDAGYAGPGVDHRETGVILGHSTYLHRGQVTVMQNHIAVDQTIELVKAMLPDATDEQIAQLRQRLAAKFAPTNADTSPGLVPNVMTGRIANRLDLHGPNYLVDAACSSSLLAVGAAIDELRARRSRMMLAGGVNASLPADVTTIFTQLGALSARGKVRPFESGSDGTLLGEGLGIVVLKRLSDALADGDRVYATIRGIGQASDGRGTGLLAPSVDGETLAIRRAYEAAGVDPATVSLVEAHGTGIPLGDRTEIAALTNVFGTRETGGGSIAIGSVKSMISHCIPAAGIAGLIKTALALHHRIQPPTLCETVNPELGLERSRLFVNTEARPWIAPPGAPRRAGVDSFGFGGINTHAVLEEAPAAARRPDRLADWPFELCLFSADGPEALAAKLEALQAGMARNPGWRLAEIAAALAAADRGQGCRLALVARSRDALAKGLAGALARLRDPASGGRWATRGGAFYVAQPLEGRLAFLFPGEGSQYLGMLADLALHFDEARAWLDFWRGLYDDAPGATRTDIAFPPASELTAERRRELEARLHDMDVGSEAVMVGGQALFAVLRSLGVEPDAMLGHSSGESSALVASGALPADDRARLADFIRELNAVYRRVLAEGKIPTGALLAVGALPAAMVLERVATSGLKLDVAMDNCDNQLVLYGERDAIERIQALLAADGGICLPLPFDRGYHTPAFDDVSRAFGDYYKAIRLGVPRMPLYSCASAAPFPDKPAAVRKLAAAQWSQTVRFRETIWRMVGDGVRIFVEVGPSANLTAFVDDILSDEPHLALATNQRRRHGIDQLLQTLGQLWAHRRPVDVARLFAGRGIAAIDLDGTALPPRLGLPLDNTMPVLRLDDGDRAMLRALAATAPGAPVGAGAVPASAPAVEAAPDEAVGVDAPSRAADAAPVMGAYFDLMREFLARQQSVLEGLSVAAAMPAAIDADADVAGLGDAAWPFLSAILARDAEQLVAECRLDLATDRFLRDHVLSGPTSVLDAGLSGLACVPLMASLEILAEAAAALLGREDLAAVEQVRTFAWIALDDEAKSLEVRARRAPGDAARAVAELWQDGALAVGAEVRFGAAVAAPVGLPALAAPRAPRWDGPAIYETGMFHGPIFQSLAHIAGWDEGGIDATLAPPRLQGFLDDGVRPPLLSNPVLLDAVGQLAACWIAEQVGTDFNSFPSTIEGIDFLAPLRDDDPGPQVRGRLRPPPPGAGADVAVPRAWDFEIAAADGRPAVRVRGLVNVFFPVPHRFYEVRRDPLAGWLGAPLALPGLDTVRLWRVEMLDEAFCAQSEGIFLRILAHATLAADERPEWRALGGSVRQRRQWLLGRIALKEAVRAWLIERGGPALAPADIVVGHDALGAPWVGGAWCDEFAPAPAVSLAHDARACLAAVAEPGEAVGVDLEHPGRVQRPEALAQALTPSEQAWLSAQPAAARDEALLRLWCAKEAAAKCRGRGLEGRPDAYEVSFEAVDPGRGMVQCGDSMTIVNVRRAGDAVVAVATGAFIESRVHG